VPSRQARQPCSGIRLRGRAFGCWKRTGHGSLDFNRRLAALLHVYFYRWASSSDWIAWSSRARVRAGERTGVTCAERGVDPSAAYYDVVGRALRKGSCSTSRSPGRAAGDPIQLAMAFASAMSGRRCVRIGDGGAGVGATSRALEPPASRPDGLEALTRRSAGRESAPRRRPRRGVRVAEDRTAQIRRKPTRCSVYVPDLDPRHRAPLS